MRIGINGFGRIGRNHLSCALKRGHEVVAVNDLVETATLAHLLKYDSMYGPLGHELGHDGSALFVDGRWIATYAERDPDALDREGIDVVIESTGKIRDRETAARHPKRDARKILISAPCACR
jgi:glyceraldehyde 3-phosphate dehydrogenase